MSHSDEPRDVSQTQETPKQNLPKQELAQVMPSVLQQPALAPVVLRAQKRILEILVAKEQLGEVLDDVCLLFEEIVEGSQCAIMLHEQVTHQLRLGAAPSLDEEFKRAMDVVSVGPQSASCGAAVHHGKSVVAEDVGSNRIWRDYRREAAEAGVRSCWSIPLRKAQPDPRGERRIVGTVDFYFDDVRQYTASLLDVLTAASELASFVLHNTQTRVSLNERQHFDSLTDLPNRGLYTQRLRQLIEDAKSRTKDGQERFAVAVVDLDDFKEVNDTLGFQMGDLVLQAVGQRLAGCLHESDTIARSGSDDFLLLIQGLDKDFDVSIIAEKILRRVNDPYDFDGYPLYVTASMGISVYPWDGDDAQILLRNAETALVSAKERGGSSYELFRPTMARNRPTVERWFEQTRLASQLRGVLHRDELELFYQLKYADDRVTVCGAEALVRWQHPELGLLLPNQFLPLAERMGLTVPFGEWCLETACRQNKNWQKQGLLHFPVSVNVSPLQFRHGRLLSSIERTLQVSGLDPRYLELEIIERLAMEDNQHNQQRLDALHDLGLCLSIDDFGTGFSSLSYLSRFPFDTIKIDRSFIKEIGTGNDRDHDSRNIVLAIISMARALSIKVVAEGVETEEQVDFLFENECDVIQGFYFARPEPADKVTATLQKVLESRLPQISEAGRRA